MKYFRPTVVFIIVVIAAIAIYDVWAAFQLPNGDATISAIILSASQRYPVIPLIIGILMGHLFFPNAPVGVQTPTTTNVQDGPIEEKK